jgi:hypothetical protein
VPPLLFVPLLALTRDDVAQVARHLPPERQLLDVVDVARRQRHLVVHEGHAGSPQVLAAQAVDHGGRDNRLNRVPAAGAAVQVQLVHRTDRHVAAQRMAVHREVLAAQHVDDGYRVRRVLVVEPVAVELGQAEHGQRCQDQNTQQRKNLAQPLRPVDAAVIRVRTHGLGRWGGT